MHVRSSFLFGFIALIIAALFTLFNVPSSTPVAAEKSDVVPGQYIVVLNDSVSASALPAVANEMALRHGLGIGRSYTHAMRGFVATVPAGRLAALQADPRVRVVAPDRYVSFNPKPCRKNCDGGGGGSSPQEIPTGIDRIDAELSATANIDGVDDRVDVDVAVIDTGISSHPDLNVVGGYNCSKGKPSNYSDGNGHGTHVAGTIAALDNDFGVVGVAPGARLWAVRVLNNAGSGTLSDVICGIDWVTANADTIEVANMSLGGSGSDDGLSCAETSDPEKIALCNATAAGVTFAVAAGNESDDAANHTPAAYDMVITVSALADFDGKPGGLGTPTCRTDEDDTFANFSNYGADVDIIAPGVCIKSTWNDGGYNTISGTSMATPHVAGAAALYKATHPNATPDQVKSALQSSGTTDWDNSDDPDGIKEPLLNVGGY